MNNNNELEGQNREVTSSQLPKYVRVHIVCCSDALTGKLNTTVVQHSGSMRQEGVARIQGAMKGSPQYYSEEEELQQPIVTKEAMSKCHCQYQHA
jgi:hypothetical protein